MRKIDGMYLPTEFFLSYRRSRVHYCCWGAGPRLLFAFHGYGESASSFDFLGAALKQEYSLIAIDLPFHGKTDWNEGVFIEPQQLYAIMEEIAASRKVLAGLPDAVQAAGWTLIGYSMGGRIALQLLQDHPDVFERAVLLAPDGLRVNPWYWLGTQTVIGNRVFRWTVRHPGWLFFVLRAGNLVRVVNPSVFKFVSHYIGDVETRQLLYARWTAMSGFRPRLPAIAALILRHRIPVELFYGSYDRIIRWERGERFRRSCALYCQLTLLSAGHQLLQPKFMEVIVNALYLPIV
jgi:pimeloyl-ACP methyl ester carboxylesterase